MDREPVRPEGSYIVTIENKVLNGLEKEFENVFSDKEKELEKIRG